MQIKHKTVEQLSAQVALYANSQSESKNPGRARELLLRLGDLPLYQSQAPDHITYTRKIPKRVFINGVSVVVEPAGTLLPLFDKKEYTEFLKNPTILRQSRNLAAMLENYSNFTEQINRMNIHNITYEEARQHPNVLGMGSNKAAFEFSAKIDGEQTELVALVDHATDKYSARTKILERAALLALTKDMPGFEQGVAWSNDPPVVVAKKAAGLTLDKLSDQQKSKIPEAHWSDLRNNVSTASLLGVSLDLMPGNFCYDEHVGFTVIDFRRCKAGDEQATLGLNLHRLDELRDSLSAQNQESNI